MVAGDKEKEIGCYWRQRQRETPRKRLRDSLLETEKRRQKEIGYWRQRQREIG